MNPATLFLELHHFPIHGQIQLTNNHLFTFTDAYYHAQVFIQVNIFMYLAIHLK